MDFFIFDQTEEHSPSIIPNLEEKPIPEIRQQPISYVQKGMFQPLEPIYEEEEGEYSTSVSTMKGKSCSSSTKGITKSSWSGSTVKCPSITNKTGEKLHQWTQFIKPEHLGKTVITDLKKKYEPFQHKKVKSALKDECDKEIVSQEWPLILNLQNRISYFPYSDKYVVQDLQVDSVSKFPGYEEKKPKGERLGASVKGESEESKEEEGEEGIRTTLYLPSITPPSSPSTQSETSIFRRPLDVRSIPAVKRKEFMQLMNDSEKAEFQKIIEELDTKKQDDPQAKKEQKVQEELHYLSARAPPPPKVVSSISIQGECFGEQVPYELSSESSREDEIAEDMEEGEGTLPAIPWTVGEGEISEKMERGEGSIPIFPKFFGETEIPERMEGGEGSVPEFLKVVGENEMSERMEGGEGRIPAFPEFPGEKETTVRMEIGEDSILAFPEVVTETETSKSMTSEENATSKSSESVEETEYSETNEESIPLLAEDKKVVSTQREATSYIKHKQTAAKIGEGEGEFIQGEKHFQLLEKESAMHEDSASDVVHSLLHDVVKTAETEAQKLLGLSETKVSKPIQINSWEEDYSICFTKYLKTLPEPIRNLMEVIPKKLKEQVYEFSSEDTSQLLDLPGISDTIKSDNLVIDQNQVISLTQKICSAEVLQTVTDCEDEVWIPKLNAYYAYTEEVVPAHRLAHFMCTALESLEQKYETEALSCEMVNKIASNLRERWSLGRIINSIRL